MVRTLVVLVLFGFVPSKPSAFADYPEKPISVICPWSAGGGTDRLTRYIADRLQSRLNETVLAINRTGGSGAIGHEAIAEAKPDGYTIGMITAELSTMKNMGICERTYRDYTCLLQLNADAAALMVRKDAPWKNLSEFLEEIRTREDKLILSGTATGGLWDLARAGMLHAAGLEVNSVIWVPTKGSAPSVVQLLGGHIDAICCSVPEVTPQLESGDFRVLAVFSEERLPEFPDYPTAKEQGLDWVAMGWRGLALPKNTPREIVDRLTSELEEIVRSEDYLDYMKKNGFGVDVKGPEEFEAFLDGQEVQWKEVLEAAGYIEQGKSGVLMNEYDPGPYLLPIALGAVLVFGLIAQVFWFSRTRPAEVDPATTDPGEEDSAPPQNGLALLIIAALAAYLLLMPWVGFSLATVLFAAGLIWRFGSGLGTAVFSAVLLTIVVKALFTIVFKVPLPEGELVLPSILNAKWPG